MTVSLHFDADEAAISARRAAGLPLGNEPDLLEWTFFELPVHFVIGETDLTQGRRLPLLGVGPVGLFRLRQAGEKGWSRILLDGGYIDFEVAGDQVTVYSAGNRRTTNVPYRELLDVWGAFAEGVRRFLIEEFPELVSHHNWGEWFRTGDIPYLGPPPLRAPRKGSGGD